MLRAFHIACLILCFHWSADAGEKSDISGTVVNMKNGKALAFVTINLVETDSWTISDSQGNFILKDVHLDNFTLSVKCLGMKPYLNTFSALLPEETRIRILMMPETYDMEEVKVVAVKGQNISSSSVIENAALEYVQPNCLADVMQLLPGNIISDNPDLSTVQHLSIREIGADPGGAFGTAIIIDGAPVSNNANLQNLASSRETNSFQTSVGEGVDLRQFSTDNIESVEVIKGIPSVKYGDLTSAAVLVNTKAGATPYEIKLKTDPKIKQIAFGKGFLLKKQGRSTVNVHLDYFSTVRELQSQYTGYDRFTAGFGYSAKRELFGKSMYVNAKLNYYQTLDEQRTDPDAFVKDELIRSSEKGVRANFNGRCLLNSVLVTNLHYNLSASFSHQESYEALFRSLSEIQAISLSSEQELNEGIFLPSEQFTSYTVDGKPMSIYLQLYANKVIELNKGINKILYGFEFRQNANYGKGQLYDIQNPPFINTYTSRPRKYSDIPALVNYSLFLEDKLNYTIGTTNLKMQLGARLNNFQSTGLFTSDVGFYFEPRFNLRYELLNKKNNSLFESLAVHVGAGKTYKSPSLHYLYPDNAYFDLSAFTYYTENPEERLALIDTRIYDTRNRELKPSLNIKKEIGLDFNLLGISGNITYFSEGIRDEFNFTQNYLFIPYNRYVAASISEGEKPDLSALSYTEETAIAFYNRPVNSSASVKQGAEFVMNLGKIPAMYTSFILDGAWLRTNRISNTETYQYQPNSRSSVPYSYVGIYPAGKRKISERFNTTLRMITQVPKLRMILSTTAQVLWYNNYYFPFYDGAPDYLLHSDGSMQMFTQEMRSMPEFFRFVDQKSDNFYKKEKMPPLALFNVRLSKEITDKMKLSIYVNNFVNSTPRYKYERTGQYVRRNPSIYFGAELKIKI